MKLSITQKELARAIKIVLPAVSGTATIPVLAGVRLETSGPSTLCLTATDMDISLTTAAEARIMEAGAVVLDAKRLAGLVAKIPSGDLDLESDQKQSTTLRWGRSRVSMSGQDSEQFPQLPTLADATASISIPVTMLSSLLEQTLFAVGHDSARPWLNGVNVTLDGATLKAAATDSVRIALWQGHLPEDTGIRWEQILPAKFGMVLSRHIPDGDARVTLACNGKSWVCETPEVTATGRIIDGKFPDFERLISNHFANSAVITRQALIDPLGRLDVIAHEHESGWDFCNSELILRARDTSLGTSIDEPISCEGYSGDTVGLGLNIKYVLDGLRAMTTDTVQLCFNDPKQMVKFQAPNDPSFRYVVLPLIKY